MSNRQQRRARRYIQRDADNGHIHALTSLGHKVPVTGAQMDKVLQGVDHTTYPAGQHLWALFVMFRVDPAKYSGPDAEMTHLDTENLLQVSGPGCYICEQTYTPQVAAAPCPGPPADYREAG